MTEITWGPVIEWHGGPCPIKFGSWRAIRRNGSFIGSPTAAKKFRWSHATGPTNSKDWDIVSYQVPLSSEEIIHKQIEEANAPQPLLPPVTRAEYEAILDRLVQLEERVNQFNDDIDSSRRRGLAATRAKESDRW